MVHSYGLDAAISFVFLGLFGEQWSSVLTPHSMHGRHPHPSSPSLFLSLAAILLPHPRVRNLVDLAAHHAHVQLASTGTPKVARLHARVPCMQATPSLIFFVAYVAPTRPLLLTSRHHPLQPRDCRRCPSLHGAADVGSLHLKRISRRRGKPWRRWCLGLTLIWA